MPLVSEGPDELQMKYHTVFPMYAVTHAIAKTNVLECDVLEGSFMNLT